MKKINLIVVDDNVELVGMIKEYFSSHADIDVVASAGSGQEGLELIKNTSDLDLVILDLIMPGMDGVKVLEELDKESKNFKIIVLTSYNSPEIIRKVSGLGIKYFMLKPFELSDLENKIFEYAEDSS